MDESIVSFRKLGPGERVSCTVRGCRCLASNELSVGYGKHKETPLFSCEQHTPLMRAWCQQSERVPTGVIVMATQKPLTGETCVWPSCKRSVRYLVFHQNDMEMRGACREHELRIASMVAERDEPETRMKRDGEQALSWSLDGVRLDQFSKMELQDMAANRGLPTSGTVARLRVELDEFRKGAKRLRSE